ncbi:MAG: hypothetical protein KAI99_02585, partial [Cyclobacteriaceae bacterium]|nr:hypothetical protein [Cyclobacteriaceae bacterium]
MVKRVSLWLKVGLGFGFIAYVLTGLLLFLTLHAITFSAGGSNFDGALSFQDLIDILIFPFYGFRILLFIPLLFVLIGAVIGFIFEKFFIIKIIGKFNFPMIKRMPLWLKMGLSFVLLTCVSITCVLGVTLSFFAIGFGGWTFFEFLTVWLPFYLNPIRDIAIVILL